MLKVVVRKSDNHVMEWRHDSPDHRPGVMEAKIAEVFGGTAQGYHGVLIPDEDKARFMNAKRLRWGGPSIGVEAVDYTPVEQEDMALEQENEWVESEMIRLQKDLVAAKELGLDRHGDEMKLDRLKAQHEAIKDKKKDK